MVDWYRLGQLGSRMMPEYYAAQASELEAQKQRMGVEALGEEMARARDAYVRQDVMQQRQDITWEQQQADRQAKLQQAEQEKARKAQVEGAMDAFWKRDAESMKKVLELDDFQFGDGAVKLRGKNGQEYEVPNAEFVAGMTGDANAYTRALELDIKREREERARLQADASIAVSRQRIKESEERIKRGFSGGGRSGSSGEVGTQTFKSRVATLVNKGYEKAEAMNIATRFDAEGGAIKGQMRALEARKAKIEAEPYGDPNARAAALASIADEYVKLSNDYNSLMEPFRAPMPKKPEGDGAGKKVVAPRETGGQGGGYAIPKLPPGDWK